MAFLSSLMILFRNLYSTREIKKKKEREIVILFSSLGHVILVQMDQNELSTADSLEQSWNALGLRSWG